MRQILLKEQDEQPMYINDVKKETLVFVVHPIDDSVLGIVQYFYEDKEEESYWWIGNGYNGVGENGDEPIPKMDKQQCVAYLLQKGYLLYTDMKMK